MTYSQAKRTLMLCRSVKLELISLEDAHVEARDIRQRLTASYGRERVKGGKSAENPVLVTLDRQERMQARINAQTRYLRRLRRLSRKVLSVLPLSERILLSLFYVYVWPVSMIAEFYCVSGRECMSLKRAALGRLKRLCK